MTSRPDDEQVRVKFGGEINNAPHWMPCHDMGMQVYLALVSHRTRALKDAAKTAVIAVKKGNPKGLSEEMKELLCIFGLT